MAKACLVYPRDLNLNFFPLGIGYIASSLMRRGHEVTLLDITEDDMRLLDNFTEYRPDIFGISITTSQLKLAKEAVRRIRSIAPGVPIAAGGIHPSYFKETFIDRFDVDYVVYGEGEETMCELCGAIGGGKKDKTLINGLVFRDASGKTVVNPPRDLIGDLDSIPFPARELVNYETYLQPPGIIRGIWTNRCANITTSRGCPGRCTYCGVNYIYGKAYRRRSVDNVLKEIDLLVSRYAIDGLYFMDDTFLMNSGWITEFAEKFIARKYGIKWSCYGRVDTVNEGMLRAIKEAGCVQVEYGIESCSDKVLRRIKKKTNFVQISEAVKLTKKNGIRALGSFILGFLEDSVEDMADSIRLASTLKLDFVMCFFATPYPGSELYEDAVRENRILESDMSKWYVRNCGIWKVGLDEKTIAYYRNRLLRSYRFRNLLFFIKNPAYLARLFFFMARNCKALFAAIVRTVKEGSPDDFGYYFYICLSANLKNRNIMSRRGGGAIGYGNK